MAAIDVASAGELEDGVPTVVRTGRREIVLIRWRDEIFALRNVCPHQSMSFEGGAAQKRVRPTGIPGQPSVSAADPVLVCPVHYWKFDMRTGVCTTDRRKRVRAYPVEVRGDRVLVDFA
jgi:nitrite reductase (NADH) small subunit